MPSSSTISGYDYSYIYTDRDIRTPEWTVSYTINGEAVAVQVDAKKEQKGEGLPKDFKEQWRTG